MNRKIDGKHFSKWCEMCNVLNALNLVPMCQLEHTKKNKIEIIIKNTYTKTNREVDKNTDREKKEPEQQIGSSRRYFVYVIIIIDNRATDTKLTTREIQPTTES